jgi:hypothetical protein
MIGNMRNLKFSLENRLYSKIAKEKFIYRNSGEVDSDEPAPKSSVMENYVCSWEVSSDDGNKPNNEKGSHILDCILVLARSLRANYSDAGQNAILIFCI